MPNASRTLWANGRQQRARVINPTPTGPMGRASLGEAQARLRFAAQQALTPTAAYTPQLPTPPLSWPTSPNYPPGMVQLNPFALSWAYYRVEVGEADHSADTMRYLHLWSTGSEIAGQGLKSLNKGKQWQATVTTRLANLEVAALFDANLSYVRQGHHSPALLAHEKLHYLMSWTIGNRFAYILKRLRGRGVHTDADKFRALDAARVKADADLLARTKAMYEVWGHFDEFITAWYDVDTDHGKYSPAQEEWERNWARRVDDYIKMLGL